MSNIGTIYVPDECPPNANVIFVGEAPGFFEEVNRKPFYVDADAGGLLTTVLGRNGVSRESVGLCNLAHFRPTDNKFEHLLNSPQLQAGLEELYGTIDRVKPNVICALGNWPLYFLTGKHGKNAGSGILNWRGSILQTAIQSKPELKVKVIPTVHPAYVCRQRSFYPIFDIDIKRVMEDSLFPELRLPQREYIICDSRNKDQWEHWAQKVLATEIVAVDIETFGPHLACCGFAVSPTLAITFVADSSVLFHDTLSRMLRGANNKIFHFGQFDVTFLRILGYEISNYFWDTYTAQHVMWPELPLALKYLSSTYTREPYYKDEGKESFQDKKSWGKRVNRDKLWVYNGKDCCVTFESYEKQKKELEDGPSNWGKFFLYEMELASCYREISEVGMLVDPKRKNLLEAAATLKLREYTSWLDKLVFTGFNPGSHVQVQKVLFDKEKLPEKKVRGTNKRTSNEDAIVELITFAKGKMLEYKTDVKRKEWERKFLILKFILLYRGTKKLLSSYLRCGLSSDGRIRSLYKLGPETGRGAATKFVDGTGLNAQTFPRDPLEIPDALTEELASKILVNIAAEPDDDNEDNNDDEEEEAA